MSFRSLAFAIDQRQASEIFAAQPQQIESNKKTVLLAETLARKTASGRAASQTTPGRAAQAGPDPRRPPSLQGVPKPRTEPWSRTASLRRT